MNNKKNIENLLKDKLNQQEFDIQDQWMDDMSNMLDDYNEEPKSKKGIFFILTGLILIVGLIGSIFLLNKESKTIDNDIIVSEQIKKEKTKKTDSKDLKETNKNVEEKEANYLQLECEENEYSIEKTSINSAPRDAINLISKNQKKSKDKEDKTKKTSQKVFKETNKNTFSNNKNLEAKEIKKSTIQTKEIVNNTKLKKENSVYTTTNSLAQNKNTISTNKTKKTLFNITKDIASSKKELTKNTQNSNSNESNKNTKSLKIDNTLSVEKSINSTKEEKEKTVIEVLSAEKSLKQNEKVPQASKIKTETTRTVLNDSINEELNLITLNDSLVRSEKNVQKNKKKDLGLSLSITAGASLLFRSFNSDNIKRVEEESDKISWNASFEIYKTFKNKLIIGSGINLTNYGEKINYLAINTIVQDTNTSILENNYINLNLKRIQGVYSFDSTYFTQFDTVQTFVDSAYLNEEPTKENGRTNFTYLEIPVKIGYKILDSKKFAINAMTGISFGFLIQNKGSYINTENDLYSATSQKVLFNYLLSADFIYKINQNINLTISPHFKYNLNNLSTLNATKRKYSTFGINGGIILDF